MARALPFAAAFLAALVALVFTVPSRAGGDDAIAVIVNPKVRVTALGRSELRAIFTAPNTRLRGNTPAVPFNLPPRTPLRVRFDKAVLGMDPDQVAKFWIDQRIRGKGRPPRQITKEPLVPRVVAALKGAVAYMREKDVPDSVTVVARITDGKVLPPSQKGKE